jgi:hypothetical protein
VERGNLFLPNPSKRSHFWRERAKGWRHRLLHEPRQQHYDVVGEVRLGGEQDCERQHIVVGIAFKPIAHSRGKQALSSPTMWYARCVSFPPLLRRGTRREAKCAPSRCSCSSPSPGADAAGGDPDALLAVKAALSNPTGALESWTTNSSEHCTWVGSPAHLATPPPAWSSGSTSPGSTSPTRCGRRCPASAACSASPSRRTHSTGPALGRLTQLAHLNLSRSETSLLHGRKRAWIGSKSSAVGR